MQYGMEYPCGHLQSGVLAVSHPSSSWTHGLFAGGCSEKQKRPWFCVKTAAIAKTYLNYKQFPA